MRPGEGGGRGIDILFVAIGDVRDFQQDAAGDAAFKIGPVDGHEGAGEADAAFCLTQVGRAEGGEFLLQQRFEAARTGCKAAVVCVIHPDHLMRKSLP